jgi:hypothetical protein
MYLIWGWSVDQRGWSETFCGCYMHVVSMVSFGPLLTFMCTFSQHNFWRWELEHIVLGEKKQLIMNSVKSEFPQIII